MSASHPACWIYPCNYDSYVDIYNREFTRVYKVPSECISHLPPLHLQITRLVRCAHYKPYNACSCFYGEECKFVHANCNYETLYSYPIHVNYIWQNEEQCIYPRLLPGTWLQVFTPHQRLIYDNIPSELILITAGSLKIGSLKSFEHCKHYYYSRECDRGINCEHIHAVYVDHSVQKAYKRAPPCLGRKNVATDLNLITNTHTREPLINNVISYLPSAQNTPITLQRSEEIENTNYTQLSTNSYNPSNKYLLMDDANYAVNILESNPELLFNQWSESLTTSSLSWPQLPILSWSTLEFIKQNWSLEEEQTEEELPVLNTRTEVQALNIEHEQTKL